MTTLELVRRLLAGGHLDEPVRIGPGTGELGGIRPGNGSVTLIPRPGRPGPRPGTRWPASRVKPCGTEAAYRRHKYRGEQPCPADIEAAARAQVARKRARKGIAP